MILSSKNDPSETNGFFKGWSFYPKCFVLGIIKAFETLYPTDL